MMKGLEASTAVVERPGAAAAMDQYAKEQQSARLRYVFGRLDRKGDGKIDAEELAAMLTELGCTPRKKLKNDRETVLEAAPDVGAPEDMIWEVDEDGDGCVSWEEYLSCYERAAADRAGREPRKLSALIEFLMLDEDEHNWVRPRPCPRAHDVLPPPPPRPARPPTRRR